MLRKSPSIASQPPSQAFGGEIAWNYSSFAYTGNRSLREVSARYLAPDALHATSPMWSYGISRPDAQNSVTVHSGFTLSDASGVGAKTWSFNTTGSPWQIGLISDFKQLTAANGTVLHDDQYTWSQDPAGHPYISAHTSITDPGTGYAQSALSTQTLDRYGNVTRSVIYPYNNATTPLKTYNNTYLAGSGYLTNYVFNLLSSSQLTPAGGSAITLASNSYDGCYYDGWGPLYTPRCFQQPPQGSAPPREWDSSLPVPVESMGLLYSSVTPSKSTGYQYYPWGTVAYASGSDGTTVTASADSATNYAAPQTITAQSYTSTIGYTSWLGVAQTTGPNGDQLMMTYDQYGRPTSGKSAYGGTTSYSYNTSAPFTQTESGPSGVTITTLDGFGRAVLAQKGDSATPDTTTSYTASVYAPCACSPLGKLQKISMPYPSGGSASAWTTYTYDGLGRPVSQQKPDGASTTFYNYAGNQTTVTDPAGKWKTTTTDVSGNLTQVLEPDPANQPGGTLTTNYTYDWMGHVTQVSMPRGSTTQTRTFVYDNTGRLTSATNPENGTVTYTYNTTNTLASKTDAKGQKTVYTYDSLNRVTQTQRYLYIGGMGSVMDTCGTVMYTYDTNPVNSSFSQYGQGRLTTVQYIAPSVYINPNSYYGNGNSGWTTTQCTGNAFTEMYSYHPAGAVTAKNVGLSLGMAKGNLEVDYGYDSAGRTASVSYPLNPFPYDMNTYQASNPHTLSYGYDGMGRPVSLTDSQDDTGAGGPTAMVQSIHYDFAGRLASLQQFTGADSSYGSVLNIYAQETRGYNVNGQLGSQSWGYCQLSCFPSVNSPSAYIYSSSAGMQYTYSATQNNGQITQAADAISGETISYQYDTLKRVTSAAATPINGSNPAAWTQTFQYDGFGNLTAKVLNGTTTPIAVTAATNQLTNAYYDANGNMTSGAGATLGYDEANRLVSVAETSGGQESYGYDPANKRIYQLKSNGQEWFTFYGAKGEKLGVYAIEASCSPCAVSFSQMSTDIWFAGKLIWDSNAPVIQDRLGSNRGSTVSYYGLYPPAQFYPFGDEVTSTTNDREKFATYLRDSFSGLDYADQRFYASTYGRFNTPDPYMGSAAPGIPSSWNRYSYALSDPIGRFDPTGQVPPEVCSSGDDSDDPSCGSGGVTDPTGYCPPSQESCPVDPCTQIHIGLAFGNVNCGSPVVPIIPVIPVAAPSIPIYCEPDVIKAMTTAWYQTQLGMNGKEAGFAVTGVPTPGSYGITPTSANTTSVKCQATITMPPNTFAIFHVHPNGCLPTPSPTDIAAANNNNFDIYTFGSGGLYES